MKHAISLGLVSMLICRTAVAQGLKGAPEFKHFGQPQYISGDTDSERWKTFLAAEPQLIGSTAKQVESKLGQGVWDKSRTTLEYCLTGDQPVDPNAKPQDRQYLHLVITFKNAVASRFTVEARNY